MPNRSKLMLSILALIVLAVVVGACWPGAIASCAPTGRVPTYAVVLVNDAGELNLENGQAPLSVQGLINALGTYPAQGWDVYQVIPFVSSSMGGGTGGGSTAFVVVLRR